MSDLRAAAASFLASRNGTRAPSSESTRYSDRQVVFQREFSLGAPKETYPPGTYTVETAEEIHDLSGRSMYVRSSCILIVPTASGTRSVQVSTRELDAALQSDSSPQLLGVPSENPDSGEAARIVAHAPCAECDVNLDRYGIERVRADVFVWRGYRYTNASDAIAAATRANSA